MKQPPVSRIVWSLAGLAVVGCGPASVDDGDGTGSATSTTTTATDGEASASATMANPTGDGTTGDGTTGDATTGVDTGSDTGAVACELPEDVSFSFTVSPDEAISATCSVLSVTGDAEASRVELDCEGQLVTLDLAFSPAAAAPQVSVDQLVHLAYVTDPIFWINRWVALHTTGGLNDWLLVGGVEGSTLDPPGTTLDAFFGAQGQAPTVTEATGLCAPQDDVCGPLERIALDFGFDLGTSERVLDHSTGYLDGYPIAVERAQLLPGAQSCDDVPPAWFDFGLVWFSSD